MKTCLYALLALMVLTTACSKSKKNDPIGDRREMLKNSTWRVTQMRDNGKVIALGCKADDRWIFPDGSPGRLEDGDERCTEDPIISFNYGISGDQRDFYIWEMSSRSSYGSYIAESTRFKWKILYMTNNELEVEYYYPGEGPNDEQHFYELKFLRVE